jgi:outer membrane protein
VRRHALLLGILVFSRPLFAADLLQTYREARANDPVYASALAARDAGRESLPQGMAQMLPKVVANASTQMNYIGMSFRSTTLPPSTRNGNTNTYGVTLTQPLFNWQAMMEYKEAGFKVAETEAVFGKAAEDLILRVAQAYFDVLASQDSLAFIQAQKAAISEQLAQAKRNFEVGTATITDTHEALARFDLATSQEIAAQSDLEIKKSTLQQIIGKFPERLTPLRHAVQLSPPQPNAMEQWISRAEDQNFAVRAQQAALAIASREVERGRAGHYPTINMVGNFSKNSASIFTSGPASYSTDSINRSIGLQLSIPLYSGGGINSLVRQAIANQEKARHDLENARRSAALAAHQAYLGVTNGIAQVKALEAALVSSQSALDSNKLGYRVGVRIEIDVLNAQQQLFSTMRDLAQARYNTLLNGLKLKAAAGTLTEKDLETVNRLLGTS